MHDSSTSSPHQISSISEATCTSCSMTALVKAGTPCVCGGVMRAGQEMLRKAFGREDTDLVKAGNGVLRRPARGLR